MKPERVQTPSIFTQLPAGDQGLAWSINTDGFNLACQVARALCDLLENLNLLKSINIKDSGVELWINNVGNNLTKSSAEIIELMPRLAEIVKQCLARAEAEKG
jgi:hypothetical protein